jgi:hypothetical protein
MEAKFHSKYFKKIKEKLWLLKFSFLVRRLCKSNAKLKDLQTTNVSYLFLSMDKTADKWKAGIEKHN